MQQILEAQRQSGERSWRHYHYLRGSLFCAECGRRLFFTRAHGRGGDYDYFICGGNKARICSQPHHRVEAVEAAVEHHYTSIQLTDEERARVKTAVEKHVHALAKVASRETARAQAEVTRLDNEERKLLQAHYADQISDHIYTDEQQRIRRERAAAEELLRRYEVKHDVIVQTLDLALQLTDRTQTAYLQAEPTERRLFNQAFFERIEIDTEEIIGHTLNAPYAQIRPLLDALPAEPAKARQRAATGRHTAAHAARTAAKPARKGKTPGLHSKVGGSYLTLMVEESGASLNRIQLASAHRLVRSLSGRSGLETPSQSQIRPRAGAVQQAVIRALMEAGRPLRAREIHQAAQKLAGTPLSWNTVKDCLHKNARRPESPIERVTHGRYRHR